mgnify:CR=1 FL=1
MRFAPSQENEAFAESLDDLLSGAGVVAAARGLLTGRTRWAVVTSAVPAPYSRSRTRGRRGTLAAIAAATSPDCRCLSGSSSQVAALSSKCVPSPRCWWCPT